MGRGTAKRVAVLMLALLVPSGHGNAAGQDARSPEWRDEIAQGFLPYRRLALEDFPVNDRVASPYQMHTQGFIRYTYQARWSATAAGASAEVVAFSVRSGFDRNSSWRRSATPPDPALLAHEQGHLDINEVFAARLAKARLPGGLGFSGDEAMEDLRRRLKAMADRVIADSRKEQELYDLETRHGADRARQQVWTERLERQLRDLKIIK